MSERSSIRSDRKTERVIFDLVINLELVTPDLVMNLELVVCDLVVNLESEILDLVMYCDVVRLKNSRG